MYRVQINQKKRVRRRAFNFVDKRMKLDDTTEDLDLAQSSLSRSAQSTSTFDDEAANSQETSAHERNLSSSNNQNVNFNNELASWVVNSKTPAMHIDSLLRILQKKAPELPTCCKTLLQTPKNAYEDIIPMCNGSYLHIGLKEMLTMFLRKNKLNSKTITIDVGIDGTPTTDSSDTELWPIMANVVGFEDVLLIGSYFGSGKPKDDENSSKEFLTPFVTEVLEILNEGGISFESEIYDLKFRAFVMDAPARAFIMNTLLYTGYHSCTKCVIPGIRIANRLVFHGVNHELRSNYTFRNRIHSNHHHSNDITMIENLPIDCIKCVPIDPMHNIYLGVMKQLLSLWILHRKRPYSISAKNIKLLSERILQIAHQLPSEFCKKPRHFKFLKRFKGTEFRQFTLYTLIIVLEEILPPMYYKHFLKFHCAVRILSTPGDCIRNNNLASELLTDFVKEFGASYGYHNLSFNVHSLLHLSEDVMHYKCPLESYSAFKFENFLQYLKKLYRNNYRVLEQIRNRFFEKFLVHDYQGDFKRKIKINKPDKFGNFNNINMHSMHLSVNAPNNYVLTNDGSILKIKKISRDNSGSFKLMGNTVKAVFPFYAEPIPSNLLNIYVSTTDDTTENITKVRVTKELHKVARVELNSKYFYLALLH